MMPHKFKMLDKIYNKAAQFREAISRRLSNNSTHHPHQPSSVYTGMPPSSEEVKVDTELGSEIELFFKQGNVSSRE